MKFTKQQIEDWVEYENVRASGAFNMWFPQARKATGLSSDRYGFVMRHFSELKKAHENGGVVNNGAV